MKTKNQKEIYLAGGCFWGMEEYFSRIPGVESVTVGYANGRTERTSYSALKQTGHAETIHLCYDKDRLSLREILLYYFRVIDPTSRNKQGNDVGLQYRTGIYYTEEGDKEEIEAFIQERQKEIQAPIVVEREALRHYILAESYHQAYLKKNLGGYCHIDVNLAGVPVVDSNSYKKLTKEVLKENLSETAYQITQEEGTEPAFSHPYWNHFSEGIYVDVTTGEPLFFGGDKFDLGCGWPSFSAPIVKEVLDYKEDNRFGMKRIEVHSRVGGAHLGHVFPDGPQHRGGLRYCINGNALRFVPKEEMEAEGYGFLLEYMEKRRSLD